MAYTYTSIDGQRVQSDVAAAFGRLNAAFQAAFGLSLHVNSGTRTTEEQRAIFLSRFRPQASGSGPYGDVRWYQGVRYVRVSSAGTVAVPGTSNHEENGPIGPRALDIRDSGGNAGVMTAGTQRANWIRNNASKYGFNPAGYNFGEPWHIEYTGQFGGGSPAGGTGSQWPARERYGEAWVIDIQQKLMRLGYDLSPDGADGKDGPKTQGAVIDVQGKHGLTADGIAGPDTKALLDRLLSNDGSAPIAVDGQWGEATTRKFQRALGVTVDGQLGKETWSEFQRRVGVPVDGEPGPQTYSAMQRVLKVDTDGALGPQTISALQTYLNAGGNFLEAPQPPTGEEKLVVDGQWGESTTRALQKNIGLTGAEIDGAMGPNTWKRFQKVTGQAEDGIPGPKTIKALQVNVGLTGGDVDGSVGPKTVTALQNFLNANGVFQPVRIEDAPIVTYPKPEAPTYPGATYWNHSPNSSPRREGDTIQYFVVHHAASTASVQAQIDRFMAPNDRNVSPNWLIGADGSVSEIVPPDKYRAWTTGQFDYKAVTVETQNTSGDPNWGISEESHVAIAKLVAWAHLRYGLVLDRQHVLGHREVPGVPATACPGPSMNVDKIVQYAIQYVNAVPPVDPPVDPPVEDPKKAEIYAHLAEVERLVSEL